MHPERQPEQELYRDEAQARTYFNDSRKGTVALAGNMFVRKVLKKFKKNSCLNVLDLGTGAGWIPIRLKQARPRWKITAVDLSEIMLKYARETAEKKAVKVHWLCGMAGSTGLPQNSFDLVISHFALHEFQDLKLVFTESKALLKPGGCLFIEDLQRPSKWGMFFALAFGLFHSKSMRKQYKESLLSAYTANEVKQALNNSGLKGNVKRWTCLLTVEAIKEGDGL